MILKIVKNILLGALITLILSSAWFSWEFNRIPSSSPRKVLFEIDKGASAKDIARSLKEKDIILKRWVFLLGYRIFFNHKSLKAGEYEFSVPFSNKQLLRMLTEGKIYLHPVTIPEGLTRKEIAQLLQDVFPISQDSFLKASSQSQFISSLDKEAGNLEGYLFPETYHFPRGISQEEIVTAMVSQFKNVFSEEWKERARELRMSIRDVVILASLIEKETSLPEEKPLVSAVFHNRLKKGMKLDCDPTIIYALKEEDQFQGRLRSKDLKLPSPYNTYLYAGLPPSPIANPGKSSLKAALYPADEEYLYFVSKNDGSHHFSRSFKEHQIAVQKYQKNKSLRK